jgi:hypothetical protein
VKVLALAAALLSASPSPSSTASPQANCCAPPVKEQPDCDDLLEAWQYKIGEARASNDYEFDVIDDVATWSHYYRKTERLMTEIYRAEAAYHKAGCP